MKYYVPLPFSLFYCWGDEDDEPEDDTLPEYDLSGPAITTEEEG
jgi:hypothetical protein